MIIQEVLITWLFISAAHDVYTGSVYKWAVVTLIWDIILNLVGMLYRMDQKVRVHNF